MNFGWTADSKNPVSGWQGAYPLRLVQHSRYTIADRNIRVLPVRRIGSGSWSSPVPSVVSDQFGIDLGLGLLLI